MVRRVSVPILCLLIAFAAVAATPKTESKMVLPKGATMTQQVVDPGCSGGGKELEPPAQVTANADHVLNTKLEVWQESRSVPVLNPNTGACTDTTFNLRMYKVPGTDRLAYPGPTLKVARAERNDAGEEVVPGDRIRILLENHLTPNTSEACVWAEAGKELCDCTNPDPRKRPQCCSEKRQPNGMNCFHGANDTNLHFHGTHVSPQDPQDYVLLQLQPFGTTSDEHNMPMGNAGTVKIGSFQYDVNPLPWNQAEGTHWYHPHKHGSTALQVGEGMAGALLIEGPFDHWLNHFYNDKLKEKLMVIQTIHDLNFTSTDAITPMPLINGQVTPKITMNPGEIQRWRMVSATMEASAQLEIDFNGLTSDNTTQARQIAMDGVQFSRRNYQCQPLFDNRNPRPCDGSVPDQKIQLSPGNRADFLVKAPGMDKAGKRFLVPFEVFGSIDRQGEPPIMKNGSQLRQVTRELTRQALDKLAPGAAQPALFSVYVCKPGVDEGCVDMSAMKFPTWNEFPDLPKFMRDIVPNRPNQNVQYQILKAASTPAPDGVFAVQMRMTPESPLESWQFNEDCANFTEPLDPAGGEEWHISQNINKGTGKRPLHVFHIHTNPFQVVGTEERQPDGSYKIANPYPTPIWQDSITLPNNKNQGDADKASTRVVIRQRFEDYTGPYVLHCHFLGHEDRGMMVTVQTVCPEKQDSWSVTSTDKHECTFGQFIPALKPCTSHLEDTGLLPARERKHKH